jgi:hypothetical protein
MKGSEIGYLATLTPMTPPLVRLLREYGSKTTPRDNDGGGNEEPRAPSPASAPLPTPTAMSLNLGGRRERALELGVRR